VSGNTIEIYSTYSFVHVGSLKGHNGKVRSVAWNIDDTRITTCGLDGAVYVWDSQTLDRVGENVLKSCGYQCVAPSPDGKNIFAVGSDKTLKQIRDNMIVEDIPSINKYSPVETTLTQVVVSSSGRMLLAATESGTIRAVKYPLTTPWEGSSLPTHCGSVRKLKISPDDQYLFSVGVDGCVMVYKLSDKVSARICASICTSTPPLARVSSVSRLLTPPSLRK
jgi:WD40 repeat protein